METIKKVLFYYVLVLSSVSVAMEKTGAKFDLSYAESNLQEKFQSIATTKQPTTLSSKEREDITKSLEDIRLKVNLDKIYDWIAKEKPSELSPVVLYIRNSSQKLPLKVLAAILNQYERGRDGYGSEGRTMEEMIRNKYIDPETKKPREYKGDSFVMNPIPSINYPELSVYSQYMELPPALQKALESLGYVKFNEASFAEEIKLANFINSDYRQIKPNSKTILDTSLANIIKIRTILDDIVSNKQLVENLFNELGTTGVRFLLLRNIFEYYGKNKNPYLITNAQIISIYNRLPEEVRNALQKHGYVQIIQK